MIMKSLMLEQLEKIKPFKISNRSVTITKHILENGQLATQIEPGQPINLLEIYKSMNGTEINHHSLLFKI